MAWWDILTVKEEDNQIAHSRTIVTQFHKEEKMKFVQNTGKVTHISKSLNLSLQILHEYKRILTYLIFLTFNKK